MDLIRFVRVHVVFLLVFSVDSCGKFGFSFTLYLSFSLCPSVSEAGVRYSFLVYDTISKGIEKREVEEVVCQASAEKSG